MLNPLNALIPKDWFAFKLLVDDGEFVLGALAADRARAVADLDGAMHLEAGALSWRAHGTSAEQRSDHLAGIARQLQQGGWVRGWRDECFRCELPVVDPLQSIGDELFRLERAAFRFFGLMSRAVHVNGYGVDSTMWCGRRAMSKTTDAGKLDNLAAGGLGADESILDGVRRELWEEAGVPGDLSATVRACGALRSTRLVPDGLHDEILHVFSLQIPDTFEPTNQDGEVSAFLRLDEQALARCLAQDEFSIDAAAVIEFGRKFKSMAQR
ncbi:MAG: DUF4743 domain-containing protein [Burkholderiaceae bacterium]|nr:DUF4743 domain-containing protein [Burkholderiaceae bacterium]